jgi:hypothetical protein
MRPPNRREKATILFWRAVKKLRPSLFFICIALLAASTPRLPLLMGLLASGTRELKADGTLQLSVAGAVRLSNGVNDNCCCACWTCTSCTDTAPAAYIVTFTGISFCNTTCARCNADPGSHSRMQSDGSVDGTYTVPCDPAATCIWQGSFGSASFTEWSDPACGGALQLFGYPQTTTDSIDLIVSKITEGGIKKFHVAFSLVAAWTYFDGRTSVDTCGDSGGYSVSNSNVCSGCVGGGSGGTADLDPVAV